MEKNSSPQGFTIFRGKDAPGVMESGCITIEPFTDTQQAALAKAVEAGYLDGDQVKVLVNIPGFSLTYAWFKKSYPLGLHSHNVDCLYYILAGTLRLGTCDLGPQDGFFVPAGAPYSFKPGPQGVEVLEFRHANQFNFRLLAKNEAFWNKAIETIKANHEDWKVATPPSRTPG